jgi:hypothetical protein
MALTCLKNGAGLFIGATGGSQISENNLAMQMLYDYAIGLSAGASLRNHKQSLMRGDFSLRDSLARKWTLEYQIFGDPAFGVDPGASPAPRRSDILTRASEEYQVHVPEPVFIANGGMYDAMIPRGGRYSVEGYPSIPYHTVEIELPNGMTVSSFDLSRDGDWTYFEDLDLRPFPGYERASPPPTRAVEEEMDPDDNWYPMKDFEWRVRIDPLGTRILVVSFFPFYYDIEAGTGRFAENWTIAYETKNVHVEMSNLMGPKQPIVVGENASFSFSLSPIGLGGPVGVAQWIEDPYGEIVDELGSALLDVNISTDLSNEWMTQGVFPGSYVYFIEVTDDEGILIETGRIPFLVGAPLIEISVFSADPIVFSGDSQVNVEASFSNKGELPIEGNATLSLLSSGWNRISFVEINTTLEPESSVPVSAVFDMIGLPDDVYIVRARFQSNLATISDTIQITRSGYVPPEEPVYDLIIQYQVSENITDQDTLVIAGTITRNDGLKMEGIGVGVVIGDHQIVRTSKTGLNGTFIISFWPAPAGVHNVTILASAGLLEASVIFSIEVAHVPGDDDDDDIVDDDVDDDDITDDDVTDDDVTDDDTADDDDGGTKTNWGLIGGIIVGMILLLLGLIFIIIMARRFKEEEMDWDEE